MLLQVVDHDQQTVADTAPISRRREVLSLSQLSTGWMLFAEQHPVQPSLSVMLIKLQSAHPSSPHARFHEDSVKGRSSLLFRFFLSTLKVHFPRCLPEGLFCSYLLNDEDKLIRPWERVVDTLGIMDQWIKFLKHDLISVSIIQQRFCESTCSPAGERYSMCHAWLPRKSEVQSASRSERRIMAFSTNISISTIRDFWTRWKPRKIFQI